MTDTPIQWFFLFDWDGDGSFGYDESAYVIAPMTIDRGRQNEHAEMAAGKMCLTLRNNSGRFDPWDPAGPLYGKVVPRRGVMAAVAYPRQANRLANAGFEDAVDLNGWEMVIPPEGAAGVIDVDPHSGLRACMLVGEGSQTTTRVGQAFGVTPGCWYLSGFWARGDGVNSPRCFVWDVTNGAYVFGATETGNTSTGWRAYNFWWQAPAGCTSAGLWLMAPLASGGQARFDDAYVLGPIYPVFVGYLEDIQPTGKAGQRRVQVTAYDGLRALTDTEVDIPLLKGKRTDECVAAILDDAGWPAGLRALDVADDTHSYFWFGKAKALTGMQALAGSERGALFCNVGGAVRFIGRSGMVARPAAGSLDQANLVDMQINQPLDGLYNVIRVRANPITVSASGVLWKLADNNVALAPGESKVFWAEYRDPATNQACAADNVIAPVANTDYLANTAADMSGTDMTSAVTVAATAFCQAAKLQLTNTDTVKPLFVTLLQLRGQAIVQAPTEITAEDDASIGAYGRRELAVQCDWQQSLQVAQDQANFLLDFYKGPRKRILATAEMLLPDMVQYELMDRIRLTADYYGIAEEFRLGRVVIKASGQTMQVLTADLYLEPCDNERYWLVGVAGYSELANATRLGY